ncbi:MAG: NMD3-related protein [Candidatus Thermoplasmatota archaeon]|nr:NMD3-related protein [Candidatus Thermoplasmatota archaeon]
MLCLRCGVHEQFHDNLCRDCLISAYDPFHIASVIHGTVCPDCNKVLRNKTWADCQGSAMEAAVQIAMWEVEQKSDLKNVAVEFSCDRFDKNVYFLSGEGRGSYMGIMVMKPLTTEVRLTPNLCVYCSRRSGNYYEAILQLRGIDALDPDQQRNIVDWIIDEVLLQSRKDPNVFVTRDEKVRGGHDFYMGNNSFARQIAIRIHDQYGGEMKVSKTLFTRKDGRDIYRVTYLVRLPGFVPGDYLSGDGSIYKVKRIHSRVKVIDVASGREEHLPMDDAMRMTRLSPGSVEVDAVVLSEGRSEIQVLDPVSMRTRDVILPEGFVREEGATVRCARIDDELYLI